MRGVIGRMFNESLILGDDDVLRKVVTVTTDGHLATINGLKAAFPRL